MQITLLTPQFAPHFEGGTERVARAQAEELLKRGHRVRVLSGTDRPRAAEDLESEEVDGVAVTFLPRRPEEPYDLGLDRPRLAALLARETADADVCHLHHWSTLTGSAVRDLRAAGKPVVVTLHDLFTTCPRFFRVPVPEVAACPVGPGELATCAACCAPDAPGIGPAELEHGLAARATAFQAELDAAGAILVPSAAHRANLERFVALDPAKTRVLHHGLCARIEPTGGPTALPYAGGPLRVLCLGHRTEVKGVRDLVEAAAGLEDVELVFLGDEVQPGFDAELLKLAAGTPLDFGGGYEVRDLARRVAALGGAHLAAFPSRVAESYGLVLDEAQALGLPVWVADRGALPERVGAAGRVLPAEDPPAWRAALLAVLARPGDLEAERRVVPLRGRTAAQAALELEEVYQSLLPA